MEEWKKVQLQRTATWNPPRATDICGPESTLPASLSPAALTHLCYSKNILCRLLLLFTYRAVYSVMENGKWDVEGPRRDGGDMGEVCTRLRLQNARL